MSVSNWILAADEGLTSLFGQWDKYTTSLAAVLLVVFAYQVFSRKDPDAHPMLLARQSQASAVRNDGESPIYRSHSSPHGMELCSGLNVRDEGMSRWARGRDGDLRDVWRRVVTGAVERDGSLTGVKGRILTVLGTEQLIEHDLSETSRQINIIGQHIRSTKATRVAIYLPNSIELLVALFACLFYDATPIILPYSTGKAGAVEAQLRSSAADCVIAAVGSISVDKLSQECTAIHQIIWVVDEGSRHMDWDDVPKGVGKIASVWTWQEVVEDAKSTTIELPAVDPKSNPRSVVTFAISGDNQGMPIEFTQANLIAAISAQLAAIPVPKRITTADLVLPADSLSTPYTLVVVLAALYSNASLALNSVAGEEADLELATRCVAPTLIVASTTNVRALLRKMETRHPSWFFRMVHFLQRRSLVEEGIMPAISFLSKQKDSVPLNLGSTPGKLRILFVWAANTGDAFLSTEELSDLRIHTGSRVIYALTAPQVAGSVAQTALYDYRIDASQLAHFGPPLSSLEIYLKDTVQARSTADSFKGELFVRGPAVLEGQAALGSNAMIRDDHTLALLDPQSRTVR